ncbi:MAG: nitroreductase [Marinilabiliaceae bacterium]|nr:nitroreductase [Marinilabiliaceae bacterium]
MDKSAVILENLKTRRAVRTYSDSIPDKALIEKIVEAGSYAPTGMGMQSPIIIAVTNKGVRDTLSSMNAKVMGSQSDPFYGAPVVLVVLADKKIGTYQYDGSLVMGNLMNAAHAVGLSSCWIHRAKEMFETPEGIAMLKEWGYEGDYEGIGNCIIGYNSGEAPTPKPRKADYIKFVE